MTNTTLVRLAAVVVGLALIATFFLSADGS